MKCCSKCFNDIFLQSQIENLSSEKGRCFYCQSKGGTHILPEELTDYFLILFDIYIEKDNGIPLLELIQRDWQTFACPQKRAQDLLENIIKLPKDKVAQSTRYAAKYSKDENAIRQWESFAEELKFKNRFMPQQLPNRELLIQLFDLVGKSYKRLSQKFYRARVNIEGKQYNINDLQKPPAGTVLNGRANPIGISYLYTASDAETAIAEIRGYKGEKVSVLEFNIDRDMALLDLRHPYQTVSPFEKSEYLEVIYRYMPYLEYLGRELSKPVIPHKNNLEYLTSQYLCEFIKQMGYDGIIYNSSIAQGDNYVIFNDNLLKPIEKIHEYEIAEMSYTTKEIYKN